MSKENKQNTGDEESLKADFDRNSPNSVSRTNTAIITEENESFSIADKYKVTSTSYAKKVQEQGKSDFVSKATSKQELSK